MRSLIVYVMMNAFQIITWLGVTANDFHDRLYLTPNVCAVYVEKAYRIQVVAGQMLQFVCNIFAAKGIDTLYWVTDYTSVYKCYDWRFLCMLQGDGESDLTRMYIHQIPQKIIKNKTE